MRRPVSDAVSILLVEDEAPQRQLISEILGRDGYAVREAGTLEPVRYAMVSCWDEEGWCSPTEEPRAARSKLPPR